MKDVSNIEELNDQLLVRRQKLSDIREKGIDPFGQRFERTHLSSDVFKQFDVFTKEELEEKMMK